MKFLALCTCERVIIDKQGAHSLINIMLNAELQISPEQVPRNAVAPTQWFAYSMWMPSAEDIGQQFEQVYQVYWPDGEKFIETRTAFPQLDETVQQVSFGFYGLPVGQSGKLRVVTWLDKEGQRITEPVETSIHVKHLPKPTATPTSA
jgi:hypothetical protein